MPVGVAHDKATRRRKKPSKQSTQTAALPLLSFPPLSNTASPIPAAPKTVPPPLSRRQTTRQERTPNAAPAVFPRFQGSHSTKPRSSLAPWSPGGCSCPYRPLPAGARWCVASPPVRSRWIARGPRPPRATSVKKMFYDWTFVRNRSRGDQNRTTAVLKKTPECDRRTPAFRHETSNNNERPAGRYSYYSTVVRGIVHGYTIDTGTHHKNKQVNLFFIFLFFVTAGGRRMRALYALRPLSMVGWPRQAP